MAEILAGKSTRCQRCANKANALTLPKEQRVKNAIKASKAASKVLAEKVDPYKTKYGDNMKRVLYTLASAKQRCTNPKDISYGNYGGRGIVFKFPSVRAAAEWVLDNLGVRPSPAHSIDRVDNARGYEPGNLRWATRAEQARNKRAYRRSKTGERIRRLSTLRPDLTYETLRSWIVQGASDEEIINRRKYARSSI